MNPNASSPMHATQSSASIGASGSGATNISFGSLPSRDSFWILTDNLGNDFFLEDPTASALARRRAVRQTVTDPDRAHLMHALAWHESQLDHAVWCRQVANAGRFQYARDTITGKVSYFAGTTEQFDAIVVRPAGDEEETSGGLRTATADMKDPGLTYASRLEQPPASAPPRVSLQKVKALSRGRASRRGYEHPHGESQVVRTPYQWHGRAQSRLFPEAGHRENEAGGSKPDGQATEEATQGGSQWLNKMHPNTLLELLISRLRLTGDTLRACF
ncbi:hypothetical protein KC351_g11685 [Hortaea werneckii]|nr:hypothetical protein KC351_g11685 [Hortaea werneckii]